KMIKCLLSSALWIWSCLIEYLVFSSLLLIRSLVSVLVILHFVMPTAKENRDGRNSLIKRALFILVLLSLVVLQVYCVHSKSKQTPPVTNLLGKFSSDITVRPAIPADYAYYLEIYPDRSEERRVGKECR